MSPKSVSEGLSLNASLKVRGWVPVLHCNIDESLIYILLRIIYIKGSRARHVATAIYPHEYRQFLQSTIYELQSTYILITSLPL